MENLKTILGEKRYAQYFKHHAPDEFVNFGLGFMSKRERQDLIDIVAIKQTDNGDVVACDAFCVNVHKNGEPTCVYEGTKFNCEQEAERIKREKAGIDVKVRNYPKAYFEYYENKKRQFEAREANEKAVDSLVDSFGGEIVEEIPY